MLVRELKSITENNFWMKYKDLIINIFKLLVAISLLIFIAFSVNISDILYTLSTANTYLILLAFSLSVVNIYLQFYKWQITVNSVLSENNKSKIWLSLFYGFSAGVFTPGRVGEYFGRNLSFKDKSFLQVAVATILDKVFTLILIAFLGSLSGIYFLRTYYQLSNYLTLLLFIFIFILFYLLMLLIFNEKFWNNIVFSKIQKSIKLSRIFEKLKVFKKLDKKYAVKMFLISLLFYLCFIIQYAILVSAFSNHFYILNYLWVGSLLIFVKSIFPPITFGELGIREGASVFFITQFGESAATGFNAAISLFFINILIPALVGFVLLFKKNNG